jgi:hypothetical protein
MTTPINSQGGGRTGESLQPNKLAPEAALYAELKACPWCGAAVMERHALWPSEGDADAIIHAAPTECGLVEFSIGASDGGASTRVAWNRRASTGGERERLKELEDTLSEIARGDVPSPSFGHYLAHRHAVKLARRALSASSGKGGR